MVLVLLLGLLEVLFRNVGVWVPRGNEVSNVWNVVIKIMIIVVKVPLA